MKAWYIGDTSIIIAKEKLVDNKADIMGYWVSTTPTLQLQKENTISERQLEHILGLNSLSKQNYSNT